MVWLVILFGLLILFSLETIAVPDYVRELSDSYFQQRCMLDRSKHIRLTFGPSSSLEWIGAEAFGAVVDEVDSDDHDFVGTYKPHFTRCGLVEITIPDGVRELGDGCFKGCKSLCRATTGPSSSLERLGAMCFDECNIREFEIPASL